MKLFCVFCTEDIKNHGTIKDGKPFHDTCLFKKNTESNQKKIDELSDRYPFMSTPMTKLFAQSDKKELLDKLEDKKRPWAVIYSNDIEETDVDNYASKKDMLIALADWIQDAAFDRAIIVGVEYILHRGKLRYDEDSVEDELSVKVTL